MAPSREVIHAHSDRERSHYPSGEKSRDLTKDFVEVGGHSFSHKMGDRDDRNELKMFQRRDRKREDEKLYNRDIGRQGSKSWRDSDFSERSSGRDQTKRSGSPRHEMKKKPKESSERPDRSWRERDSSERRYSDRSPRGREEHSSWHKSRASSRDVAYRDRVDHHSWKDRGHRDRVDHSRSHRDLEDQAHTSRKDWSGRGYSRDRDYDKGDWGPEAKEGYIKSRSVNAGVEACEVSMGIVPQRSRALFTGEDRDQDSPTPAKSGSLEKSSQGDVIPSDNMPSGTSHSRGRSSSSFHEGRSLQPLDATQGGDNRSLPKLKLKVGRISHTLLSSKRQSEGGDFVDRATPESGQSVKKRTTSAPEPNKRRQRLILQEDSDDDDDLPPTLKERGLLATEEDGFLAYLAEDPVHRRRSGTISYNDSQTLQAVRKSSRIPKKRVFDDGDDEVEVEPKKRKKKKVEIDSDEDLYRIEEDEVEPSFVEEEELEVLNDSKSKFSRKKRSRLDADSPGGVDDKRVVAANEFQNGVPLTARQRALQSSKEGLADIGASLVEFPEGLTHTASKKSKEALTVAERQLKKEEAAQKRRQQVEKAAKEIQAVAIQKILCQDSQRKKREGKLQKQREEMEQEKKAAAMAPATNSIRWTFGPNGTVVSFSQDLELPQLFSGPLSYPGERERCAGPSCNNAYRYRDSKTLLPLCSLQCYKAVQKNPSEAALAH